MHETWPWGERTEAERRARERGAKIDESKYQTGKFIGSEGAERGGKRVWWYDTEEEGETGFSLKERRQGEG